MAAQMKRGKDTRKAHGQSEDPAAPRELMAMMLVLVEKSPGAFTLRLVSNDELIDTLRSQGALKTFLEDADRLYADFRDRFQVQQPPVRPS